MAKPPVFKVGDRVRYKDNGQIGTVVRGPKTARGEYFFVEFDGGFELRPGLPRRREFVWMPLAELEPANELSPGRAEGVVPENGMRRYGVAKNKVVKENRYSDGTLATVGDVVLEDGELYVMIAFKDGIAQLGRVVKRVPIETCQKRSPEQALCDLMDIASRRNQPEPPKPPAPEAVEDSPLFKGK